MKKLVHGAGRNDAGYRVHITKTVNGRQVSIWTCPFYGVWKDMMRRCYSASFHDRYPTYAGCSVVPEWLSFSAFREWMSTQQWRGMHLDKDLLIPGNKVYGPELCAFIQPRINNFLTDNRAARGKHPIGVTASSASGSFVAKCNNPFTGECEFLGHFQDQASAANAWKRRKNQHACAYADLQHDARVAAALRIRYADHSDDHTEVLRITA